ncbi:MAG: NTP transferase domain-containing protein [Candidatus Rokubacteria bacterium]|nr:NTP transferase domain-containing protein [Candidatus Rokubacteria bacterium]
MSDHLAACGHERWGLILAGGEGRRLRRLTEAITGEPIPKQFCAVIGGETLVERTRRRAALAIPPARTLVMLTRRHERFYRAFVAGMPPHCAIVQPDDRGTGAAILYGLLRIAAIAPMAAVAILPSDHWVSDDAVYMRHVATAFSVVRARPDLLVLLGIPATSADREYGWIEPGEPIPGTPLSRVAAFAEKPSASSAEALLERGGLWNTFVMIGRIPAFLSAIRRTAPEVDSAFETVRESLGTADERMAVRALYAALAPLNFSERVLQARPANLAVLPVGDLYWSDWGTPERVLATLTDLGVRPTWLERLATA